MCLRLDSFHLLQCEVNRRLLPRWELKASSAWVCLGGSRSSLHWTCGHHQHSGRVFRLFWKTGTVWCTTDNNYLGKMFNLTLFMGLEASQCFLWCLALHIFPFTSPLFETHLYVWEMWCLSIAVLTLSGFSPLGWGEKGKEWLQGILTPRFPPVCAAAHMLDCSVSSPGTLDAFYFLPGTHWHKSQADSMCGISVPIFRGQAEPVDEPSRGDEPRHALLAFQMAFNHSSLKEQQSTGPGWEGVVSPSMEVWHLGIWLIGHGGHGSVVGLNDNRGLLKPYGLESITSYLKKLGEHAGCHPCWMLSGRSGNAGLWYRHPEFQSLFFSKMLSH